MNSLNPVKVKFKLEGQVVEEVIENNWTIGKIKGKIRKSFQINPYFTLQFLYNGEVLENDVIFKDVKYSSGSTIKVMTSRASEI